MAKKPGTFTLGNNLLTIRFWSKSYTTSIFKKQVKDYMLLCQYPLSKFNLDILKDISAAQVYLDIDKKVHVARMSGYHATITPEVATLQVSLTNIHLKETWDLEWTSISSIYEEILADKSFFKHTGKKLESFVKPLGLVRKPSETDQMLRRRTLSYLQFHMNSDPQVKDEVENLIRGQDGHEESPT